MRVETFTLGELEENAYLVLDEASSACVMIDPGDGPKPLIERIERGRLKLAAVLLTHGHWDHISGVREVRATFDAPVYLHGADASLYSHVVEQAAFFGFRAERQPPLDHQVKDGDMIEAGPFRFEVIHTPGHTPGGSSEQLLESIREKIFALDDAVTLYPGHGPPTTVGAERASNPFLI
jgi:hydroxyacylglutathione hydrolase